MYAFAIMTLLGLGVLAVARIFNRYVSLATELQALVLVLLGVGGGWLVNLSLFAAWGMPVRWAWVGTTLTGVIIAGVAYFWGVILLGCHPRLLRRLCAQGRRRGADAGEVAEPAPGGLTPGSTADVVSPPRPGVAMPAVAPGGDRLGVRCREPVVAGAQNHSSARCAGRPGEKASEMASGERPPGVRTPITPEPHVVVELARPARGGQAYRIEAPDRVLRMWFLLNAVAEERQLESLPPQSQARVQRLLRAIRDELERSVSPALAGELHHLLGWGQAGPEAGQLRIALASLLGWTGGLVISMLSELEAAQAKQQVTHQPLTTPSGTSRAILRHSPPPSAAWTTALTSL